MIGYVLLIMFAWFIEMPLWLSIVTTCLAGIGVIFEIIKFCVKARIENDLD